MKSKNIESEPSSQNPDISGSSRNERALYQRIAQ